MEMAGQTFTEAELDDAMKELDPSGDGQVDFEEFKKYWEDNIVAGGCAHRKPTPCHEYLIHAAC